MPGRAPVRERPIDPVRRRAALVATAVTLPVILIVGLVLGHAAEHTSKPSVTSSGGPPRALPPVTVAAPPSNAAADVPCTKLLGRLPLTLSGLAGRPARSSWTYVAAWGDPAIVLTCGVGRPKALEPGSTAQIVAVDGVNWLPVVENKATAWTVIDRGAYVEVRVPKSYAQPPLAPIADAVAKALPPVCVVDPNSTDPVTLCTHRR